MVRQLFCLQTLSRQPFVSELRQVDSSFGAKPLWSNTITDSNSSGNDGCCKKSCIAFFGGSLVNFNQILSKVSGQIRSIFRNPAAVVAIGLVGWCALPSVLSNAG